MDPALPNLKKLRIDTVLPNKAVSSTLKLLPSRVIP
jgi:hypothetical protein